jgi:hypothetical protein
MESAKEKFQGKDQEFSVLVKNSHFKAPQARAASARQGAAWSRIPRGDA